MTRLGFLVLLLMVLPNRCYGDGVTSCPAGTWNGVLATTCKVGPLTFSFLTSNSGGVPSSYTLNLDTGETVTQFLPLTSIQFSPLESGDDFGFHVSGLPITQALSNTASDAQLVFEYMVVADPGFLIAAAPVNAGNAWLTSVPVPAPATSTSQSFFLASSTFWAPDWSVGYGTNYQWLISTNGTAYEGISTATIPSSGVGALYVTSKIENNAGRTASAQSDGASFLFSTSSPETVPEPTAFLLMGSAFATFGAWRQVRLRKKMAKSAARPS